MYRWKKLNDSQTCSFSWELLIPWANIVPRPIMSTAWSDLPSAFDGEKLFEGEKLQQFCTQGQFNQENNGFFPKGLKKKTLKHLAQVRLSEITKGVIFQCFFPLTFWCCFVFFFPSQVPEFVMKNLPRILSSQNGTQKIDCHFVVCSLFRSSPVTQESKQKQGRE